MFEALIAVFVFLAIGSGLLALLRQFFMPRIEMEARLRSLSLMPAESGETGAEQAVLRSGRFSIPGLRGWLTESPWLERWGRDLEQADLRLRAGEYLLIRALFATLFSVISLLLFRNQPGLMLLAVPAAAVGFMLPALYLNLRRRRRISTLDKQLVEMIRLIANALRSGFAFMQGVDAAAKQLEPPLSTELNRLLLDVSMGANTEEALHTMARRIGSYDLDMIVTAILIQRSTGGNLSEILDHVGETMRERDRLRGEVRALTAQQRFSGTILAVYPAALAGVFFLLNPDMMSLLWKDSVGQVMLGIAVALQIIGYLLMRRILAIEVG